MSFSEAVLYRVYDPMCSWCWGFRRFWDTLREALPATFTVVNVVGGLAPDSEQPMSGEQQRADLAVAATASLPKTVDSMFWRPRQLLH